MPIFLYRARSEAGKFVEGEMKHDSAETLKAYLKEKGYASFDIRQKKSSFDINNITLFKPKVNSVDLSILCKQFSIILEAGVPIATALDVLRTQTVNEALKYALNDVYEDMQKGVSLSTSMKAKKSVFPSVLVHMVEAGEISGQLEQVFSKMADNFEKESKLAKKVKGALTYPVIVTFVAILVVMVLMIKVVPSFVEILFNFKVELPLMTKILIQISDLFRNSWIFMICFVGFITIVIKQMTKSEVGKDTFHEILLKIPVLGGILKKMITVRFTMTLGMLLSSGVLLIQSLEVVQKLIDNSYVQKKIAGVLDEIKKGRGLYAPLVNSKFFPPMLLSMVKIGEESGELEHTLEKCGSFFEQEVETALERATALIEPTVMIIMSAVVAFIVLSILQPMFSIYNSLSGQ